MNSQRRKRPTRCRTSIRVLACCLLVACESNPTATPTPHRFVGVFEALSIQGGAAYPYEFSPGDTAIYSTMSIRSDGTFDAWCLVSRAGVRGLECEFSGPWEEAPGDSIILREAVRASLVGDTLLYRGDGGHEVFVRCESTGQPPCESERPDNPDS